VITVGLLGAGAIGRRVAYGCVSRGLRVSLFDADPRAARAALAAVRGLIGGRRGRGRAPAGPSRAARPRLSLSPSLRECVAGADLVIEAGPERVEMKRRILAQSVPHLAPHAWVASCTSVIPGSWLAEGSRGARRLLTLCFGGPEDATVEIMGHAGTDPSVLDAAERFLRSLRLIPVRVRREIVGYAGNRIWRAIQREVLFLIDHGYATAEEIDRGFMLRWGTLIGPCGVMDRMGLDVVRDIEMVYFRESGDLADHPPPLLQKMIARGRLGEKSGRGFYAYPAPAFRRPGWLKGRG
jgi:3-hydroxybutyryl-CoA dehydrogenase